MSGSTRAVTGSPRVRARARARRAAAWRPALGAVVLIALLAVLPALSVLPVSPGGVRVGGVSIEWWYGGLLAPVAGWAVAAWALRGERDETDADRPAVGGRADAVGADAEAAAPFDPA